jgi:hypothetical protein
MDTKDIQSSQLTKRKSRIEELAEQISKSKETSPKPKGRGERRKSELIESLVSQIEKGENSSNKKIKQKILYRTVPIHPEQIFYKKLCLKSSDNNFANEKSKRIEEFGEMEKFKSKDYSKPNPDNMFTKNQTNLFSKNDFAQIKDNLIFQKDNEFSAIMRDTQGNRIQQLKHSFLQKDDSILKEKLLKALKGTLEDELINKKSVHELVQLYSNLNPNKQSKINDWLGYVKHTREQKMNQKKEINLTKSESQIR